jgi:hypothetical protein
MRRAGLRCRSISALVSPIARRSCISAKMLRSCRHAVRIRHGQGKTRPLQKRAHLPDLRHGGDAGAQPAGLGYLGLRQRIAQLVQGLAPECGGEEQAVRPSARRHCTIWPTGSSAQ